MTALNGAKLMKYNINRKSLVTAPFPRIPKPKRTRFVGEELGLSKAEFGGSPWDSCRVRVPLFSTLPIFQAAAWAPSASLHMVRSVLCFTHSRL